MQFPTKLAGKRGRTSVNIYVGNLPFNTTNNELEELFAQYGTVESANIINDRETGRSRGFGFVEMDDEGAKRAGGQECPGSQFIGALQITSQDGCCRNKLMCQRRIGCSSVAPIPSCIPSVPPPV